MKSLAHNFGLGQLGRLAGWLAAAACG